jgi:hypothetical protein
MNFVKKKYEEDNNNLDATAAKSKINFDQIFSSNPDLIYKLIDLLESESTSKREYAILTICILANCKKEP